MESHFCNYFTDLFTISSLTKECILDALQGLTPTITPDMNQQLDDPFTTEDINTALFQMSPIKAPRPDGLPVAFYKKTLALSQVWSH